MSFKPRTPSRARLMNPSPHDLRRLVLDYLLHNCHTTAARAFLRESGVRQPNTDENDPIAYVPEKDMSDIELRNLETRFTMGLLRKEIRTLILTGRIDDATEVIKKHYPSVLSEPTDDTPQSTVRRFDYLPATSTDPTHLALNLRIQAFIEAARTIPLPYRPPGADTPLPHPPLLSATAAATLASAGGGEDSAMTEGESESEQSNAQLLHRAQSLYSEVNRLSRAADRATYLVELGQVGGILAYTVPERSPLATYMTQARREAVADQIDSAILHHAKKLSVSRIELYTRYTSTIWSMLHDKEIPVPPRSKWPGNASLPPTREPDTQPTNKSGSLDNAIPTAKKASPEKETDEVLPRFDLHLFVESQGSR